MKKAILLLVIPFLCSGFCSGQSKMIIGIMPFKGEAKTKGYYDYAVHRAANPTITAIQDAVTDAFVKTKRFALVEREKMDQVKGEKNLQKNEDFIDGTVIEQSKSLGAQYLVMGNVTKADVEKSTTTAPIAGTITSQNAEITFSLKVVDVTTGLIVASGSFSGTGRGKNAFDRALEDIKPDIEKFIKENFKVTLTVASVEEKGKNGEAVKVLISGGTSIGMAENSELKVYEATELTVDGKKLTRKVTIGKIKVVKVEDENFSVCAVTEGGADIAKKIADGAKVKCEVINDTND